jgi:hypothetical protein
MSTIELKKPVPIDVGGHPAKIIWLSPTVQTGPIPTTEGVSAWLEFDPPVRGVAGFAVTVPVSYMDTQNGATVPEAFLRIVKIKAQDELFHSIGLAERDRAKREKQEKRLEELQGLAQKLAGLLEKE